MISSHRLWLFTVNVNESMEIILFRVQPGLLESHKVYGTTVKVVGGLLSG